MTTRSSESDKTVAFQWARWACENLLQGVAENQVVDALIDEGVPAQDAKALVDELRSSPAFHAGADVAAKARRLAMVVRLDRERIKEMPIPRYTNIAPDVLHRCRAARRPIVVTDLLEGTSALRTWSHDAFATRFKGVPIAVRDGRQGERVTAHMPVDELVELWRTDPNAQLVYSMARNNVLHHAPFDALVDEVELSPDIVLPRMRKLSTAMWFGPANTITPLHFDTTDVLLSQAFGRKRIQLVSPYEETTIHEFRRDHMVPDSLFEDLAARVHVFEVEIGPGEALLIPTGWYHRVTALSASISVSLNGFATPEADWYAPGRVTSGR